MNESVKYNHIFCRWIIFLSFWISYVREVTEGLESKKINKDPHGNMCISEVWGEHHIIEYRILLLL